MSSTKAYELIGEANGGVEQAYTGPGLAAEQYIHLIYGPGKKVIFMPFDRPRSPRTILNMAGQYVIKESKKGFRTLLDPSISNPDQVYLPILKADDQSKARQKQSIDPLASFKSESFQEFWMRTDLVATCRKELRSLPFLDPILAESIEQHFLDKVLNLTWKMKNEKLIKDQEMTKQQFHSAMKYFIAGVQAIRSKKIASLIRKKIINFDLLTKEQKEEFAIYGPPPPKAVSQSLLIAKKQEAVEVGVLENVAKTISHLPPCYSFDTESEQKPHDPRKIISLSEKVIADELSRRPRARMIAHSLSAEVPTISSPSKIGKVTILSSLRPNQSSPQLNISEARKEASPQISKVHNQFWENADPLRDQREGNYFSCLDMLSQICDGIDLPETDIAEEEEENSQQKSQETFDTSKKVEQDSNSIIPEKEEEEGNNSAMNLGNFSFRTEIAPSEDLTFLMKQSPEIAREAEPPFKKQLDAIWNQLGFSIPQRLEMLVKYTKDDEQCGRLADALSIWTQASNAAQNYQKEYNEFKYFFKSEVQMESRQRSYYQQLESNLKFAEDGLLSIADRLRTDFGDELILQRRRAIDLIRIHKLKLDNLAKSRGLK